MLKRRFWLCAAAVLMAALAIRLASAAVWQQRLPDGSQFVFGDSESYWFLAKQIANGEPYQFGTGSPQEMREYGPPKKVFRAPGYPLVLSTLFLVSDDPPLFWARALGAVFGTATVGCTIGLATLVFDSKTGLAAGALTALYPGAIAMSTFILAEAVFCPLMMLQFVCFVAAWRSEKPNNRAAYALLVGALAAAATLVRPSWLLFTPFVIGLGLVFGSQRPRHFVIGMYALVGIVIVMVPWWFRNYQVTGSFVPTTLKTGASLYDGLNSEADGSSNMSFDKPFHDEQRAYDVAHRNEITGTFEERLDNRMRDAAVTWARDNPGRVVQLAGIKFTRMWDPWPSSEQFQSVPLRVAIAAGYLPLLLGGLWGAVRFRKRSWPVLMCAAPAVYFTLLHMIFVSSIRYRQPAMLTLIVLAAAVITQVLLPRRTRKPVAAEGNPSDS